MTVKHGICRRPALHGEGETHRATMQKPGSRGYSVCWQHGAGRRGRPGGRPIIHGRYSQKLPDRLAGRYLEALADPHLLALREEVALTDTRIADLLERVDTGESGELWRGLKEAWREFEQARLIKNAGSVGAALTRIGQFIERGQSDYAVWAEIGRLLDQRRRLAESERKRLVEAQQIITTEQAMILLAAIVDVIRRNVDDRETVAAISADIRQLVADDAG